MRGIELDGACVCALGLFVEAAAAQHDAEIVPGIGVPGHELDHAKIGAARGLELLRFSQDITEVVPGIGVAGRQRQRAFDAGDRAVALSDLVIEHAEEVQRVDVIGIPGEDVLIDPLRLDELTGAVQ